MPGTTFSGLPIPELPDWVQHIRPSQVQAVWDILDAFDEVDHVFLEAPTGAGKTLIAELVAQELRAQTLYTCSDKSLQDQFARDFPYAKVLKGRANYPVQSGDPNHTAADCIANTFTDPCWYCPGGKPECPYEIAKAEALEARLAVTNISYLLAEANYVGKLSQREFIIVDEADTLESQLMGFVEYRVPKRYMDLVQMEVPKKGARKTTLAQWLGEYADAIDPLYRAEPDTKRKQGLRSTMLGARRMVSELNRDIAMRADNDSELDGMWLREYEERGEDADSLILKPVMVNLHGPRTLWRHGEKWLIMSATIISADEMADSLGLPFPYRTVKVPSDFPVENRPVVMAPVANMTYKDMNDGNAIKDLQYAIQTAAMKHPKDRILIHAVSYHLSAKIVEGLKYGEYSVPGREIVTYKWGKEREYALSRYKRTPGAILVSPSMERGIDLPDDLCRVQIIAKCPFPALRGTVSARTHLPNGNMWYAVQTIRDIVQMCGRGVRHREDWCTTYIFDRQFASNLWNKWKPIFPDWFRESVDTGVNIREFLRPAGR